MGPQFPLPTSQGPASVSSLATFKIWWTSTENNLLNNPQGATWQISLGRASLEYHGNTRKTWMSQEKDTPTHASKALSFSAPGGVPRKLFWPSSCTVWGAALAKNNIEWGGYIQTLRNVVLITQAKREIKWHAKSWMKKITHPKFPHILLTVWSLPPGQCASPTSGRLVTSSVFLKLQRLSPGWGHLGWVPPGEGRAGAPGTELARRARKKWRITQNLQSLESTLKRQSTACIQTLLENWGHLLPKFNSFERGGRRWAGSWDWGGQDGFQPGAQPGILPWGPVCLRAAGQGSCSASHHLHPQPRPGTLAWKGWVSLRSAVPRSGWA